MKILFRILFFILPVMGYATDFQPYEWEKDRARITLTPAEQALPEIILKSHTQYDYVLAKDEFWMYTTVHKIILVNNTEAVQKHNRIFISMRSTVDLVDVKARSISKSGKIVLFDKSNLKEVKDEESGSAYRIFAIEGIELGSEVEYYYIRKMEASLFDRTFIQNDVQIKNSSFVLSCPAHLKYDFKSYYGYPEVKTESKDGKNIYSASMADVPGLKDEPFSYAGSNRKRIEFKLSYNTARSQARLYSWDDAAKAFYKMLTTLSKDDEKAVDKFLKTLGDKSSATLPERITNIEQKIKSSIQINKESGDESLKKIESILKFKVASRDGITRLFIAIYDKLGIANQIVVTCSREEVKFDPTFDSWSYLDDYLLYFPASKGFIAPYAIETRYPLVPAIYTAHKGLFIEPFAVGEVKSGLGSINEIPAADYKSNADNLDIDVAFDEGLANNQIRIKREFSGYNASFIVPYYDLMTQEQRLNMVEELTKQTAPDTDIKTWTAQPAENRNDKFIIDVDFKSAHFLEKAGPRVLFKVGALIGPQTEMYRDDKRVLEIENSFNRGYDRIIKVNLPAGYIVKNADDLKINVVYIDKDETPFLFQSDYTIEGNTLRIVIAEYYKTIYAPLERYEDYRKVINAAADFNKVTLVLEKKK